MITHVSPGSSSILESTADYLVIPVCTVGGVMGAGLAKQFADRWPHLIQAHARDCKDESLIVGGITVNAITETKKAIFFATKDHFSKPSRLDWVKSGLDEMVDYFGAMGGIHNSSTSIAVPALGCGLGNLSYEIQVKPLILAAANQLESIKWMLYPPGNFD